MTLTRAKYPEAPVATPWRGSLLAAANVGDGIEWLEGPDLYETYNGMDFGSEAPFCVQAAKTITSTSDWVDGFQFAAYGGVRCQRIGLDLDNMRDGLRKAFDAGESKAVEAALMKYRFQAEGGTPELWPAATDLTPVGGAVSAVNGLALLEGHAAANYVGVPTIHVPISVGTLLASSDVIQFEGDTLKTKMGSKVAAGAGYESPNTSPAGAAAPAGERWIYASGEVTVRRGDLIFRDEMDPEQNEVLALVERPYVIAAETFTAAVRVKVENA